MSKKKKIIVLSCMIALLAVTAVFNFVLTGASLAKKDTETTPVSGANFFSNYRNERLTTRNETLLQLDAIVNAAETDSEEKNAALAMKLQLTELTQQELLLETLIKAQGFEDSVVTLSLNSDNVNVIVKSEDFTQVDAIRIYTIMDEEIGRSVENVKITPIS